MNALSTVCKVDVPPFTSSGFKVELKIPLVAVGGLVPSSYRTTIVMRTAGLVKNEVMICFRHDEEKSRFSRDRFNVPLQVRLIDPRIGTNTSIFTGLPPVNMQVSTQLALDSKAEMVTVTNEAGWVGRIITSWHEAPL